MLNLLNAQDVKLLETHLQAIVEVEMFTVPLYLTAVYSFTDAALAYSATDAKGNTTTPLYDLQQNTLSVAVQEMYHLQLACNLANAFQVSPQLPHLNVEAGVELTIPHLDPQGKQLTTKLGNLPQLIEAMIAVETPDPDPQFPEPNETATYHSISDLYHATLQLLSKYLEAARSTPHELDPHFTPDNKQIVADNFLAQYRYNTITTRSDVVELTNAITDQGEGKPVSTPANAKVAKFFAAAVKNSDDPNAVDPKYQPTPGSRFYKYDMISHYARFLDIKAALEKENWEEKIGGPVFYEANRQQRDFPKWAEQHKIDFDTLQTSMNTIWTYLIELTQTAVNDGVLHPPAPSPYPAFREAMLSFKYLIPLVWQTGYCPSFMYTGQKDSPVTGEQAQAAMDKVDPLCLFHWDAGSIAVRNNFTVWNACQGLNQCKGQGWGGIATQAGDGACATADFHTCSGGNSCQYQGGCGFLSNDLPDTEQWIPGENSKTPPHGQATGGCQTPIAMGVNSPAGDQVFDRNPNINPQWSPEIKARLEGLKGKSVWNEARNLFAQRLKLQSAADLPAPLTKQEGNINYDGHARRQAIAATSK